MGVTITATNSEYVFDMGYGGFCNLRTNIARALDPDFGENYALLRKCHSSEEYEENDRVSAKIVKDKHLKKRYGSVINFLYMPDVDGEITYGTCGKIADLLEPHMDDLSKQHFRYEATSKDDYGDFVAFLRECVKHRRKMRWG